MQTVVSSCGRQGSADFRRNRIGGSAWESNPPGMGLPPHNGFEDRGSHRATSTPMRAPTK